MISNLPAPAFPGTRKRDRRELAAEVLTSNFTRPAKELLMTAGAHISKLTIPTGHYYDLVLTDLVTPECAMSVNATFDAEGLPRWPLKVIDWERVENGHPYFPDSTSIQLFTVHPEAF
ncbi:MULTISPECIES: hypothetical protein [Streptomyces]|uniref:hypothetical protein n=1 Tax=Streptomyces TaxID=1883 RepID=UPI001E63D30B|nr:MULTISPECIES: hypothetical protein [Streptomyces]UFQ16397.1 hypothetical protein J2N69_16090 [Streptomyces huasconensis]WCL86000.1 hypothetical protein PPN52_16095 [Streptomyces sp. JCM 35825]